MSARKHRGRWRDGLFDNPGTDTDPRDNPKDRGCPWCHAAVGRPCTVRGRTMRDYHPARRQDT